MMAGLAMRCSCLLYFVGQMMSGVHSSSGFTLHQSYVVRSMVSMLVGYCVLCSPVFAADALQQVMNGLSNVKQTEVRYQEEKYLSIMDLPLVQNGSLLYIAPDQFIRSLDGPGERKFLVRGDEVVIEKDTATETHDLNSLPMVKAFIASFGATLAGDLPRLQRYYRISFSGELTAWQLGLQPIDTQLASYVAEIRLWGNYDKIKEMKIHESNGDWSRLKLLYE